MVKIDLVISYYKEDLSWFEKYRHIKFNKIYIYNKGPGTVPDIKVPFIEIKLPNIGRCDHTYLYHIVKKYDDLGDVTIFTTGSVLLDHKFKLFAIILDKTIRTENSVFYGTYYKNVKNKFNNFTMDSYEAAYNKNNDGFQKMELSKIRPFGKWYDSHFKGIDISLVNYNGIFSVSKKHIIQHTKDYYKELIADFPDNSNPEVGHYFERAWLAVFNPIPPECIYYDTYFTFWNFFLFIFSLLLLGLLFFCWINYRRRMINYSKRVFDIVENFF